MTQHYLHRHLTPAVGEAQQTAYGQKTYAVPDAPEPDRLGARERAFISARDSFYLASVTETGAPTSSTAAALFRIQVEAFDWNCPLFITPRFTAAEVETMVRPLRQRITELEQGPGWRDERGVAWVQSPANHS